MLFAILAHYQNAQNDVEIVSYRQKKSRNRPVNCSLCLFAVRYLIELDAVVGLGDLAGQGVRAAAHQGSVGRGVVGRTEGALCQ